MGPYGLWLLSTSARQRGGECYTLAVNVEMGPVFHSHSSQMPLYSVPPPFIPPFHLPLFPPPINDPFVRLFLPRWAGGPQQGQAPRLVDSAKSFLIQSFLSFFLELITLFFSFTAVLVSLFLPFDYLSLHLFILNNLRPHLTSRLMDF